jgi:hypothetical protein
MIHGPQDAVRHVGWPRNLEEVPTGMSHDLEVYTTK